MNKFLLFLALWPFCGLAGYALFRLKKAFGLTHKLDHWPFFTAILVGYLTLSWESFTLFFPVKHLKD
jgi:hypothetical protein